MRANCGNFRWNFAGCRTGQRRRAHGSSSYLRAAAARGKVGRSSYQGARQSCVSRRGATRPVGPGEDTDVRTSKKDRRFREETAGQVGGKKISKQKIGAAKLSVKGSVVSKSEGHGDERRVYKIAKRVVVSRFHIKLPARIPELDCHSSTSINAAGTGAFGKDSLRDYAGRTTEAPPKIDRQAWLQRWNHEILVD